MNFMEVPTFENKGFDLTCSVEVVICSLFQCKKSEAIEIVS